MKEFCQFNDDTGRVGCQFAAGKALGEVSSRAYDVSDQDLFSFCFIIPGHLLKLVRFGILLGWALWVIPDASEIRKNMWPAWVVPAVSHLLDCRVMGVGPVLFLLIGCFAERNLGLPPGPMCVLLQGITATPAVESSD